MAAPKKYADRRTFPLPLSEDDRAKAKANAEAKDGGNITAYLTRRIREDNAKLDKARREDASRNPKTKTKK